MNHNLTREWLAQKLEKAKTPLLSLGKPIYEDEIPIDGHRVSIHPMGSVEEGLCFEVEGPICYDNDSWSTIVSTAVLEHVPVPAAIFAECSRILAPGGDLFVAVRGQNYPFHAAPDLWRFTPGCLTHLAGEVGLQVIEEFSHPEVGDSRGLTDRVFHARKPAKTP